MSLPGQEILSYVEDNLFSDYHGENALFLNAEHSAALKNLAARNNLTAYQPLRSYYDFLSGLDVDLTTNLRTLQNEDYRFAIVQLTKNKKENFLHIAKAYALLKQKGTAYIYGSNENGAQRYEKELKKLGFEVDSIFKHKSRIFWIQKTDNTAPSAFDEWLSYADMRNIEGTSLKTLPGIFSSDKIDKGSKVLTQYLPDKLKGKGGDFGCGYGYLSHYICTQDIANEITCIDYDQRALDCATYNLTSYDDIIFEWQDILNAVMSSAQYDWIVMNPPFHQDRNMNKALGQSFIEKAAHSLKKNGTLYMVANTHLPYEDLMKKHFNTGESIDTKLGYKIFVAQK